MEINFENLKKIEKLGEGSYGVVYKVQDENNNLFYALKQFKNKNFENGIPTTSLREITILKFLNHENIISLIDFHYSPYTKNWSILMEYIPMELKVFIDKFYPLPKKVVFNITCQLISAVNYLHNNNILHRDIKPINILITPNNGIIKWTDFGLSKTIETNSNNLSLNVQTLWYKCPEIMLGDSNYSYGIDLWALGCVIYEVKYKDVLFKSNSEIGQLFKIFKKIGSPSVENYQECENLSNYSNNFPIWNKRLLINKNETDIIDDIINSLIILNPKDRLNTKQLYLKFLNDYI